ncbi:MarC family protein [bacterium]|nr:MarC family protein [bacterium]
MLQDYLLAFIPIFVAIDIIGIIPVYLGLTDGIPEVTKRRILRQSVLTAFLVSVLFVGVGKAVFTFLGITISDFKIAGGIILFALAINDLLFSTEERKSHEVSEETTEIQVRHTPSIGIVPIGIPLIVGPALLTTLMISVDSYGLAPTISSVVINLLILYTGLRYASIILRLTGRSGAKGIAKVVTLLLAAIGVMMVRTGISEIIQQS